MHEPPDLSSEDQLQAFEVELTRLIPTEVTGCLLLCSALFARDAAALAKVVIFVNVEFDPALKMGQVSILVSGFGENSLTANLPLCDDHSHNIETRSRHTIFLRGILHKIRLEGSDATLCDDRSC